MFRRISCGRKKKPEQKCTSGMSQPLSRCTINQHSAEMCTIHTCSFELARRVTGKKKKKLKSKWPTKLQSAKTTKFKDKQASKREQLKILLTKIRLIFIAIFGNTRFTDAQINVFKQRLLGHFVFAFFLNSRQLFHFQRSYVLRVSRNQMYKMRSRPPAFLEKLFLNSTYSICAVVCQPSRIQRSNLTRKERVESEHFSNAVMTSLSSFNTTRRQFQNSQS